MAGSRKRIYLGTTAAVLFFAAGALLSFSLGNRAQGDVRAVDRVWTEKHNAEPVDPGRPTGFSKLAKEVSPAVVNIVTNKSMKRVSRQSPHGQDPFYDFFEKFFRDMPKNFRRGKGVGTGFVIHPKGYILTNHHVIENADEIQVSFADDRKFSARVIGSDAKTDIALIKVETSDDLPVAPLGDSDKLEVGEWVLAIGNPFGLHHTVTAGIVSAKGRRDISPSGRDIYSDFIQTDASINPGNSGGPLLNMKGEVVGINAAINAAGQGIGFAIPVNMAKVLIPQLKERGRVVRSWIGIQIQPVNRRLAKSFGLDEPKGALVAEVIPGAPAAKAGLQAGDIILSFGGQPIKKHSDLPWLASTAGVGTKIALKVMRGGQEIETHLTLAEHPGDGTAVGQGGGKSPMSPGSVQGLGLTVSDVTPNLQQELGLDTSDGAVVTDIQEGSEAAEAGVQPKDVIAKVNFKAIRNATEFQRAIAALKPGDPVNFYLRRDKGYLWVAFLKK
jgi:serine protease Do